VDHQRGFAVGIPGDLVVDAVQLRNLQVPRLARLEIRVGFEQFREYAHFTKFAG
jgi:hypothetical protein